MLEISVVGPGLATTSARLESLAPRLLRVRSRRLVPPSLIVRTIAGGRPLSGPPLTDAELPALAAMKRSSPDVLLADVENWPIWNPLPALLPTESGKKPEPIAADRTFPGIGMLFDARLRPEPHRGIECEVSQGSIPSTSSGGRLSGFSLQIFMNCNKKSRSYLPWKSV